MSNSSKTIRFLIVAVCTSVGIVIGLGLAIAGNRYIAGGCSSNWHKLATPPVEFSELVISAYGNVFATTPAGETYRCSEWKDECWVPDTVPEDVVTPEVEITDPCDFSSSEFSFLVGAPRNSIDCVQDFKMYADGFVRHTYVLDQDGNVWGWSHCGSVYDTRCYLCLSIPVLGSVALGFAVGIVTSKLLSLASTIINRNTAKTV
jgi:hypothetical protein